MSVSHPVPFLSHFLPSLSVYLPRNPTISVPTFPGGLDLTIDVDEHYTTTSSDSSYMQHPILRLDRLVPLYLPLPSHSPPVPPSSTLPPHPM